MGTMIGTEPTVEKLIENITEYEYDILEAYRTAKERLSHSEEQATLDSFQREHVEQIQDLAAVAHTMGFRPARAGDWRQLLTEGKVLIASLVGELPVLTAMTHNEWNMLNAYHRAAQRLDIPHDVRAVMALHHNRTRRRHGWLSKRVESLSS